MYNSCQITTMAYERWACKIRPYLPGLTLPIFLTFITDIDNLMSELRTTFYWLSPQEFSGGLIRLKKRKKKNHIAVFSTRFYHILTCIYTVFAPDIDHILKFQTLALFLKRNF